MARKSEIRRWLTKRKSRRKQNHYSVINKFVREGKIDGKFVEQLSGLSLEDVIALKLEQANRMVAGKLYTVPIYKFLPRMARVAAMKYAISCARTYDEAAAFLGMPEHIFLKYRKQYKIESFFEDDDEINR